MIIDLISNIEQYKVLSDRMAKAIDYIQKNDFLLMEKGKYPIDGDAIFAIVNEYKTKMESDAKPETHKKYIDIQLMISGTEYMGYRPLVGQKSSEAYNPDKDIEFYKLSCDMVEVSEGMFAIFYPQDIHQPSVLIGSSAPVKKVVVKVLV